MNGDDLNIGVTAILTTLLEVGGSPESMIYMAFGSDMGKFKIVQGFLMANGFIKTKNHYVTLTPKGEDLAKKLQEAMQK